MYRMKKIQMVVSIVAFVFLAVVPVSAEAGGKAIRYSCSNQIFNAVETEKISEFTKATGIHVETYTTTSNSAVYRLMNGFSDIASTARVLDARHEDYGYKQIPFCKDPIAVITHKDCGVENVSEEQLADIFSGDIDNWKMVGGADLPILVIVPGTDTAANKNFRRQVMKLKEIKFDFMTYESTMAIEAVRHFPCGAVSFISQGAARHHPDLMTLKINGRAPSDKDYPYYQNFYYVTKGEPSADAEQFIQFAFSETGRKMIVDNGMMPIER